MRTWWAKLTGLMIMAVLLLPELAAASGPAAAPIVIVADTRKLVGIEAWWAGLYNESHIYFTILTYVCMLVVGLTLAGIADLIMKRVGIDLTSRELAEH
ncbi:MAG: hypothetical protein D4R73_03550 [Deltaproteobacteria bacterium]|nr:MAG: hypothetical protein D4R73_03550 [Deltaproteobacteria bacterium]